MKFLKNIKEYFKLNDNDFIMNEKDKLNPRAEEGIFIGYTDTFDQYLVFLPEKHQIVRAMNPRFVEDEKDFNSCRMQELLQLEKVKQIDFDDEVDENDSSKDEIENEISLDSSISLSSMNSLNSSNPPNPPNPMAPAGPFSQIKKCTKFVERPVEIMKEKCDRKPSAIDEVSQEF